MNTGWSGLKNKKAINFFVLMAFYNSELTTGHQVGRILMAMSVRLRTDRRTAASVSRRGPTIADKSRFTTAAFITLIQSTGVDPAHP